MRSLFSLFIVFEGSDGAGTGTQIRLLAERFRTKGRLVHEEEEPSEYRLPFGKMADDVLKKNVPHPGAKELQVLMTQDRAEHVKQIEEWISHGDIVICSRYLYSTLVYGEASGVPFAELWGMNKDFPRPDLAIYLDISPEEAMNRIQKRHQSTGLPYEYFEKLEFQAKVRDRFLKLVDSPNFSEFQKVDGSPSPDQVHLQVIDLLKPLLMAA